MLGLLLLVALGIWILLYQKSIDESGNEMPSKIAGRLDKLWQIANDGLRERKYLRAEKALLTILRFDERSAAAYNRLGILYAKQRAYDDAIECFEIAQSLEPSASSLHNVGLIYYETQKYEKAALAFEQALELESDLASRYIAYAKVQEKMGHTKKMIQALEEAVTIEPNPQSLTILADAYERDSRKELADELRSKAKSMIVPVGVPAKVQQPRKVVM